DDTCTDDTESVPDWAVLRCGDGLASPDLNEECDGTRGTNDTFYCNDDCKLVENECGDGVLYGDEECENIFGDDEFKGRCGVVAREVSTGEYERKSMGVCVSSVGCCRHLCSETSVKVRG
ncbi:hypothetical protein SARC_16933, partial [Sphaeroforma arctica JP610]